MKCHLIKRVAALLIAYWPRPAVAPVQSEEKEEKVSMMPPVDFTPDPPKDDREFAFNRSTLLLAHMRTIQLIHLLIWQSTSMSAFLLCPFPCSSLLKRF